MKHEIDYTEKPGGTMTLTIDKTIDAVRLRTIASLERNNDDLVKVNAELRWAIRDQDEETQRLRAEVARLTELLQAKDALIDALEESNLSLDDTCDRQAALLQVRQAPHPLLVEALNRLDAGDRYIAGQRLMEFAESELKRLHGDIGGRQ